MSRPVLEITDLRIAATGKTTDTMLVDGLSLVLHAGRTTALIGESGCGKSLTTMAILGLLPPGVKQVAGSMTLCVPPTSSTADSSPDQWTLPRPAARGSHIGLIMQNPGSCFDPLYTIRSHFRETLRAHGIDAPGGTDVFLAGVLREAGLEEPSRVLSAYPFQLSGGMLQRVMIALSLLPEPLVLLADEPLSSLDVPGQRRLMELLRRLQAARGFAMLFISHDIGCTETVADDILVMRAGKAVEFGPAGQVLAAPVSDYACELVAAHRKLEAVSCLSMGASPGEYHAHV